MITRDSRVLPTLHVFTRHGHRFYLPSPNKCIQSTKLVYDRHYSIDNPFCQLEHFHSYPRARGLNLSGSPVWTRIEPLFIRIARCYRTNGNIDAPWKVLKEIPLLFGEPMPKPRIFRQVRSLSRFYFIYTILAPRIYSYTHHPCAFFYHVC